MLKIIGLVLLFPFYTQAQQLSGYHFDLDLSESVEARTNETNSIIQIGNEQELIEYTFGKDTITSIHHKKRKLCKEILPRLSLMSLNKKVLPKQYHQIREQIDTFLDVKIYAISYLRDSTFLVLQKVIPKKTPFKIVVWAYVIKIDDTKMKTLHRQAFLKKDTKRLEVFYEDYHDKYFYVERNRRSTTSWHVIH